MFTFLNSFFSYLLLFVIMVIIAGTGIFLGITLRRRQDTKKAAEAETTKE